MTAPDVNKTVGGKVAQNNFSNTCTIRISSALNSSTNGKIEGTKPANDGMRSITGGDNNQYLFAVNDLETYLNNTYGPPDVSLLETSSPRTDTAGSLGSDPGIILFGNFGASGGMRHTTLWNGSSLEDGGVLSDTRRTLLWRLPNQ